ncbi:MAG: hypothetical protein AAGF20_00755 [Pseudomonadota bacterium]
MLDQYPLSVAAQVELDALLASGEAPAKKAPHGFDRKDWRNLRAAWMMHGVERTRTIEIEKLVEVPVEVIKEVAVKVDKESTLSHVPAPIRDIVSAYDPGAVSDEDITLAARMKWQEYTHRIVDNRLKPLTALEKTEYEALNNWEKIGG